MVHDMIEIEKMGKPGVPIVSGRFEGDAIASSRAFGMPELQVHCSSKDLQKPGVGRMRQPNRIGVRSGRLDTHVEQREPPCWI